MRFQTLVTCWRINQGQYQVYPAVEHRIVDNCLLPIIIVQLLDVKQN